MAKRNTTDQYLARLAQKPGRITEDDPRWNPATMGNHIQAGNPGVRGTAGPHGKRRKHTPASSPGGHALPWPPMGGGTKPLDPGPAQPPQRRRRRLVQPWENSRNFA